MMEYSRYVRPGRQDDEREKYIDVALREDYALYLTNHGNMYFTSQMIVDGEEEWTKIKIAEKCSQNDFWKLERKIQKSGLTGREFLENRGDEVPNGLDISYELLGMSR